VAKIRRKAYLSGHRAIKDDMPDGSNYFCGGVVLSYNSHLLECYTRARGLVESLSSGNAQDPSSPVQTSPRPQYQDATTLDSVVPSICQPAWDRPYKLDDH